MQTSRTVSAGKAFTLIELMVVIAIIGLLVAVLLPAFGTVRTKARYAQAGAQFQALATGLTMFRGEEALGGSYPPSASDNPEDPQWIVNPKGLKTDQIRIAGAHLLVHAMIGADGLGTPGFRDLDGDGYWWNDTYRDPQDSDGAYSLDTDGREKRTRYGGAGYVDDKMKGTARSFTQLQEDGAVLNLDEADSQNDFGVDELLFLDPWGTPILYYKASIAPVQMVPSGGSSGIYRQEDNGIITGTQGTANIGLDFGPGMIPGSDGTPRYHSISAVPDLPASTDPAQVETILTNDNYADSFARFILDPSVRVRPTPVRETEYLLISAGPDQRYGTDDDVVNWTRRVD